MHYTPDSESLFHGQMIGRNAPILGLFLFSKSFDRDHVRNVRHGVIAEAIAYIVILIMVHRRIVPGCAPSSPRVLLYIYDCVTPRDYRNPGFTTVWLFCFPQTFQVFVAFAVSPLN
jgi:hypothetical protein